MKKWISLVLVLTLLCTISSPVFAQPDTTLYDSINGDYQAEKLSHPDSGVKQADGVIDYDNGDPDRGQNYSWSAIGYGDSMYVGTCYAAMSQTLKIIAAQTGTSYDVFKAGINVLFNGALYMGDEKNNPGDQNRSVLLKLNTRTGEVTQVVQPKAIGGYREAVKYHDKLYFAASCASPYLLEIDPKTDETKVVYQCAPPSEPFVALGIRGLAVVNDTLTASMIGDDGTYIVASKTPSEGQGAFETIATQQDLLDYPAYHYYDSIFGGAIWDMVSFNDKLYLTVVTGKNGDKQAFGMFCGEQDPSTGDWSFYPVIGDPEDGAQYPFGLGAERSGAANLEVYDGRLYIGGYNDPMVALPDALQMKFENIYKDLSSPVCLWRMDSDEEIELVAGEPNELFPEVKGNMGAGFNDNLNQYVWRMQSYDSKLYIGTFDIGSLAYPLMQFTNGDILHMTPEEWESQINYIKELIDLLFSIRSTPSFQDETEITTEEYQQLEAFSDTLGQSDAQALAGNLAEMQQLMTEIEPLLTANKTQRMANGGILQLLEQLLRLYEENRDKLPPALCDKLDQFLNQETLDNLAYFYKTCAYLSRGERGFDLLVTQDGTNFETITRDGFGDPYNHGCRVFAVTDTGLCIGTANPFYGTQLWRLNDLTREPVQNAALKENWYEYDLNPAGEPQEGLAVEISYNGNRLDRIEYQYQPLAEGEDYLVTAAGISFTRDFLQTLPLGENSLRFYFSAGAFCECTIRVAKSAEPERRYAISVADGIQNGSISVQGDACAGDAVSVTVIPNPGFRLAADSLVFRPDGGEPVKISAGENGAYVFAMPEAAVVVTAEFERTPSPQTEGESNPPKGEDPSASGGNSGAPATGDAAASGVPALLGLSAFALLACRRRKKEKHK